MSESKSGNQTYPENAIPLNVTDRHFQIVSGLAEEWRLYMGFGAQMDGPPPSLEHLRDLVTQAVTRAPALTYRLHGAGRRTHWIPDPAFDPAQHVELHRIAPGQSPHQAVADIAARRPLPRDRPLWKFMVLHGYADHEHLLCYATHHMFQDGLAMVNTVRALTANRTLPSPTPPPPPDSRPPLVQTLRSLVGDLTRLSAASPTWHASRTDASSGRCLHILSLDMAPFRDIARRTGASIPQISCAILAGALREWHPQRWTESAHDKRELVVGLPVSILGTRHHITLGNHAGFLPITLPCGEASPVKRLTSIVRQTGVDKIARQRQIFRDSYHIPSAVTWPILRAVMPVFLQDSSQRLNVSVLGHSHTFPGGRNIFVCPPLGRGSSAMVVFSYDEDSMVVSAMFDPRVSHAQELLPFVQKSLADLHLDVLAQDSVD